MQLLQQYYPYYKKIWRLGIPIILAQLGQITVGLVDNMMIGRVGTKELAAASFGNNIFWLVIIFGTGFSYAITPLAGQASSRFDKTELGLWFKNGLLVSFIMGLLLSLITIIISLFLDKMGQPQKIVPEARSYLLILTASILPMMLFMGYKQFIEGIGNTKIAMIIILTANFLNIVFNYILIYGKLGLPAMGLQGAGYGTLISRVFMATAFMFTFAKLPLFRPYLEMVKQVKYNWNSSIKLIKMGIPIGLQLEMESSAFMLSTIMMGWISVDGLAAHQIVLSISTVSFMIYQGFSASTTICISSLFGQNNIAEVRRCGWAASHIVLAATAILSILFITTRNVLPVFFTTNPQVIALSVQLLLVMVVFQVFDGFQALYSSILRGLSDVNIASIIAFAAYFIIALPMSYLCAFVWGLKEVGIWWGLPVGLGFAALLFLTRFIVLTNKLKRKKKDDAVLKSK